MEKQTLTFELPVEVTDDLAKKITETMKNQYYWGITEQISDKLSAKFAENDFLDEVVEKVFKKLRIEEEDFTEIIASQMKDALLKCMGTIANETVKKVQEKVKSYGFIKIDGSY